MAFNPTSTISLCRVDFDNTYKHQIYFYVIEDQADYFSRHTHKTFTNYLTVRKTLPDGSMVSSVKVNCNIDDLYGYNYMYYKNENHGNRVFYAFITKLIYINEGTTEIVFETDVYQTWLFDVTIQPSFVLREHIRDDKRGANIVPEKFNFQDYYYTKYGDGITSLGGWGYLITTTEPFDIQGTGKLTTKNGVAQTGIYQGLHFYYFPTNENGQPIGEMATFLGNIDEDCVISISVIPDFCVSNNTLLHGGDTYGYLGGCKSTPTRTYSITTSTIKDFDGYVPKNNKLFTAPFLKIIVSNNNGDEGEYIIEDFEEPATINFKLYGDVSINPSLTLIPQKYKGLSEYYTAGISIKNFPQCSFNTDTFKLWLTKNQFGTGMGVATGIGEIIAGLTMIAGGGATAGASALGGATMLTSGVTALTSTGNSVYQASKEPNKGHSGNVHNNLLTAMGRNKFDIFIQRIKKEYARIVDDFFTMYGYQTNKVKVPNTHYRPHYNYVQTADIIITGAIPDDDMRQLKAVYNNGVTLWKAHATIGDYSVDNNPTT